MANKRRVLISGAGIAGSTLAVLLARQGWHVTVVESDEGVRSSGNPVDVRGRAWDVAARLGIGQRLRAVKTPVRQIVSVDAAGRVRAVAPSQRDNDRGVEVARADLSRILIEACPPGVELLFDEEITSLVHGAGADVTFRRAAPAHFDLVVGADGIRSNVRALARRDPVAPEPLGMYIATCFPGVAMERDDAVLIHNTPGTATVLHPGSGTSGVAFIFWSDERIDVRNGASRDALLRSAYAGVGWRAPELLERLVAADDIYFDAVSRVRVPTWSVGPVTLLGDAASCVSLFSDGSSSAMEGAATLAEELAATPSDPDSSLRRYERRHRRVTERRQRLSRVVMHLLVPTSARGIALRDGTLHRFGRSTQTSRLR